jgi:hypothetical protein
MHLIAGCPHIAQVGQKWAAVLTGVSPRQNARAAGSPDWTRTSSGPKLPRLGHPC